MEFAIFTYKVNGQSYIEAYPTNNRPSSIFNGIVFYHLIQADSRNQARKAAYKIWIDQTGNGFNKFPVSPIWESFNASQHKHNIIDLDMLPYAGDQNPNIVTTGYCTKCKEHLSSSSTLESILMGTSKHNWEIVK